MRIPDEILLKASQLIDDCRKSGLRLSTAESCTGGLISAVLTSLPGSSDVFDCGFVTYSNTAKTKMIGVPASLIEGCGAVSAEVALAMAEGARSSSNADIVLAVTGIAGPGGGSDRKPVGLVHCVALRKGVQPLEARLELGNIGRDQVRIKAMKTALEMGAQLVAAPAP